jgi:signal transduction histidine kinase
VRPVLHRDRLLRSLPFALVAVVGQVSAAWPPGPVNSRFLWISTGLLVASLLVAALLTNRLPFTWAAWGTVYVASVALLMLAVGGIDAGLGSLLMISVVGVALYGRRPESAAVVFAVVLALLGVSLAGPHLAASTTRRVVLFGSIAATLSFSIHMLRERLLDSNRRTSRLLHQAEAMNVAARRLASLLDPPAISALGVELAAQIASPSEAAIRRALYLRVEENAVTIDAMFGDADHPIPAVWNLDELAPLQRALRSRQPVRGLLQPPDGKSSSRRILPASATDCVWVPICPGGTPHGVLVVAGADAPMSTEGMDSCVALGHLLELALSNWSAHQMLEQQATAEERRRIARELHDGLAHELAYIASRTRRTAKRETHDPQARELAHAADRALDEARRAITVLSATRPQSLTLAVAQTAEDLASRLGIELSLDIADEIDTPGDVTENMLRIVREAMTNAANHANPRQVTVRLAQEGGLHLVVEDDGCGFNLDGDCRSTGFGLLSMEERAASIGATFNVYSSAAQGTRVEVALP